MHPWWELFPVRLEREIKALEAAGAEVRRDEAAFARDIMALDVRYPLGSEKLALRVTYPEFYPYFRPDVRALDLTLARHQHPLGKGLCLIARRTHFWNERELVADLLAAQLPGVLEAGQPGVDPGRAAALEERQADPVTQHLQYLPNSYVAIDSAWQIPKECRRGTFTARYRLFGRTNAWQMQIVVTQIFDSQSQRLGHWDGGIPEFLDHELKGRWVRSDRPIVSTDADEFLKQVYPVDSALAVPQFTRHDNKTLVELIGIVVPEEVRYRELGDGWVFVPRIKPAQARKGPSVALYRALRAGRGDLGARVPAVRTLQDRAVATFGLGALGGPVALDLARNGIGELRLVDDDIVQPGPTVRWPLGFSAYGLPKGLALSGFIAANYPRTRVKPFGMRVGASYDPIHDGERAMSDVDAMNTILDGVHLIFDGTAELGVHHLLSDLARRRGLPYVYAFASPGAWGGLVACIRPNGPCWLCLQRALYEDRTIPEPPGNDGDGVQPPGCGDVTFTGASFDLGETGLQAVRMIVDALTAGAAQSHGGWDVAVLRLRDAEGRPIPPAWTTHAIPRKAGCPSCSLVENKSQAA